MGAAWQGRGFALGPRDRPQYSPDRRVIVSYVSRVTRREGQCRVACRGGWLEGRVRRSAGGLPPVEGGVGAAWQSGRGGRPPGSLNSERWLGPPKSGARGDVGSATPSAREQPRAGTTSSLPTRRLRSALCTRESIDVAGIRSRSVRLGCPTRRGVCGVRRWRAGGERRLSSLRELVYWRLSEQGPTLVESGARASWRSEVPRTKRRAAAGAG